MVQGIVVLGKETIEFFNPRACPSSEYFGVIVCFHNGGSGSVSV